MKIDHHLQQSMLEKLVASENAVKYSDLKDDTIENSLFSYHLNKLLARGMVQKTEDGYQLTVEGARWLNNNGTALTPVEVPRVFVALVVQDENGKYLIGQRTGQFKATINDYMLPSVRYSDDDDISDQIVDAISLFVPENHLIERVSYGFVQIKAEYHDKTMRSLFCLTRCRTKQFAPPIMESSEFEWLSVQQLEAIDHPSATIAKQIIAYTNDDTNRHESPVIVG